jgi:hypothetical protein
MTRRLLLYPATVLALITAPLAAQQPIQQAKPDSAAPAQDTSALIVHAQADGTASGATVGTGGWAAGGYLTGLVTGIIGVWIARAIAGSSNVELPPDRRLLIASQPVTYQQAYEKSYVNKVKSKRRSSALRGGLIGVATFATLYVSSQLSRP